MGTEAVVAQEEVEARRGVLHVVEAERAEDEAADQAQRADRE